MNTNQDNKIKFKMYVTKPAKNLLQKPLINMPSAHSALKSHFSSIMKVQRKQPEEQDAEKVSEENTFDEADSEENQSDICPQPIEIDLLTVTGESLKREHSLSDFFANTLVTQ